MSTVTGPFAITLGTPLRLTQPGIGQVQYGYVVVSNQSQYALTVQNGASVSALPPFTENIYSLDPSQSAPITLNPGLQLGATVVSGVPQQIVATWYLRGEQPQGSWPFSLAAQAVSVGISGAITAQTTFSETVLTPFTVNVPSGTPYTYTGIAQYASLILNFGIFSPSGVAVLQFTWYEDAAMTIPVATEYFSADTATDQGQGVWQIPVIGTALKVVTSHGTSQYGLIGSNRLVPAITQVQNTLQPRLLQYVGAATADTPVQLTENDGLPSYTTLNGRCDLIVTVSVNVAGTAQFQFNQVNGTTNDAFVASWSATPPGGIFSFNHPPQPVHWFATVDSNEASIGIYAVIVPTSPAW